MKEALEPIHPAGTSVNSDFFEEISNFCLDFTMVVYEKIYFEAYKNTFETKMILNIYISYQGEPSYVGKFLVDLGMPLIFTDFQQCTWLRPTSCWKICVYQSHPLVYWKNSNVARFSLMQRFQMNSIIAVKV